MFRGEYFWALLIVMGPVAAWRVRANLRPLIAADRSLEPGGKVLVRTILVLVTVTALVNGALQYFGGFSHDPAWWATHDLSNRYVLALFIFHILFAAVVLWWVWLANGPARLLKYRAAFSMAQNPMALGERGLRWFLTLVPLVFLGIRVVLIFKNRGR